MKTVTLISIGTIKTEKERKDAKVSRKFYTAYFMDSTNPFAKPQQRNIFQLHVGEEGKEVAWKGGDPAIVSQFVGKQIPGEIVANISVKPYELNGKMVTTTSCVLLDGEKLETILKQANHELAVNVAVASEKPEVVSLSI